MHVEYIKGIRERYERLGYPAYNWYRAETPPAWQPLAKPLSECRLGMVSTAGTYVAGQVAYYYKDDTSIRRIATDTAKDELRFSHITEHYLGDARQDPDCVFPLSGLRQLAAEGTIGELAGDVFSCMGGIYSQRRVAAELIPSLREAFVEQAVDAVLLVPLCPVCHQTVCLIARDLEAAGIPTLCMASAHDIITAGQPPRAAFIDYPLGHTSGKPFDSADQMRISRETIAAFDAISAPSEMVYLDAEWAADPAWKLETGDADGGDQRMPRDTTPRYQLEADRLLAERGAGLAQS